MCNHLPGKLVADDHLLWRHSKLLHGCGNKVAQNVIAPETKFAVVSPLTTCCTAGFNLPIVLALQRL